MHAVVAGEPLDATHEARLKGVGVRLLDGPLVPTPLWASKWHRLSFNKIAALSFTQFRKVIVLDNDAGLLRNMDHIRTAPTPSAVFHTTIGGLAARTRCAVTTGLLVLRPSTSAYARALTLLQEAPPPEKRTALTAQAFALVRACLVRLVAPTAAAAGAGGWMEVDAGGGAVDPSTYEERLDALSYAVVRRMDDAGYSVGSGGGDVFAGLSAFSFCSAASRSARAAS